MYFGLVSLCDETLFPAYYLLSALDGDVLYDENLPAE
jgi:hypothetical protein